MQDDSEDEEAPSEECDSEPEEQAATDEDINPAGCLSLADVTSQIDAMAGDLRKLKRQKEAQPRIPKRKVIAKPDQPAQVKKEETDPLLDPVFLRARAMIAAAAEMHNGVDEQIAKIGQHRSPDAKPRHGQNKTFQKRKKPPKPQTVSPAKHTGQAHRAGEAPSGTGQDDPLYDPILLRAKAVLAASYKPFDLSKETSGPVDTDKEANESESQQETNNEHDPLSDPVLLKAKAMLSVASKNKTSVQETTPLETVLETCCSEQASPSNMCSEECAPFSDKSWNAGSNMDAAQKAKIRVAQKKKAEKIKQQAEQEQAERNEEDDAEKLKKVEASQLRARERARAKKKEDRRLLLEKLQQEEEEKQKMIEGSECKAEDLRKEAARRAARLQAVKRREEQLEKQRKEEEEEERLQRLEQIERERCQKPSTSERRLMKETEERIKRKQKLLEDLKRKEEDQREQQIHKHIVDNVELHDRQINFLRKHPKKNEKVCNGEEPSPARGSGVRATRRHFKKSMSGDVMGQNTRPEVLESHSFQDCPSETDERSTKCFSEPTQRGHFGWESHAKRHSFVSEPTASPMFPPINQSIFALRSLEPDPDVAASPQVAPPPPSEKPLRKEKPKSKNPVWKQQPIEIKPYVPVPKTEAHFQR